MPEQKDQFGMYVRAVRGRIVRRYGTPTHIGVSDATGETVWDIETIVPLTHAELLRYGAEYRRALSDGGLKEAKAEEWEAQRKAQRTMRDAITKMLSSARADHAEALKKEFNREPADISDDELIVWARARKMLPTVHAPSAHAQSGEKKEG